MTKHYGLLIWIPPFTMFTAEWWARLKNTSFPILTRMRHTIPRDALALSGNYCIAGTKSI